MQTAWAISHRKDRNFLTALFYPHARSQGRKKAALTVAHRVQTIAFHILRDGEVYREMGGDFYDRQHPERTAKRLLERLKQLGLEVEVRPRAGETDAAVMKAVAVEAPAPEREPSSPPENAAAQVEPAAKPVGSKTAGRPRKRPATEVDGQASGGGGCTRCDRGVSSASTLVRNEGNQKLRVSLLPRSQRGNPKCFSKE